jgi:GTP pyrophosphokinase
VKLRRKSYDAPFDEITDFAGVRVVCLYVNDIERIEKIIRDEFEVVEKVDKLTGKEPDQFGYGAIHFVVRLGGTASGARYDDLKGLLCEVQVRTILQDAWAVVAHHLIYKDESAVPKLLQRRLNCLAGLFETADDQFQQIRDQHRIYVAKIHESTQVLKEFLQTELNLDSFQEYLQWRFPGRPVTAFDGQLGINLSTLQKAGYQSLADLENELNEELLSQALAIMREIPGVERVDEQIPASPLLVCALSLRNPKILDTNSILPEQRQVIEKHRSQLSEKVERP